MRTVDERPLAGEVRLPRLDGIEPKRDPAMDTGIRLVATHPLLVFGAGAAGVLLGSGVAGPGVLRRMGGGTLGAGLGLAAGMAVSAIAQRVSGRSSAQAEAWVRQVPGAGSEPRRGERGEELRVMDWNLRQFTGPRSAVGFDRAAYDAVVGTIREQDPDVLVLQEVAIGAVESGRTDQLEMLAKDLGATGAVFVPNGRRPDGGLKGNAVLTFDGATVQDARGLHMPDPGGAGFVRRMRNVVGLLDEVGIDVPESWKVGYFPRTAGDVIVTTAGGTDVRVLNMHLSGTGRGSGGTPGSSEAQERQLVPLANTIDAWDGATIVAGDFNVTRGAEAYDYERRVLRGAGMRETFEERGVEGNSQSTWTFDSRYPMRNIDRIWVSDELDTARVRVVRGVEAQSGSDHLPVVADVVVR